MPSITNVAISLAGALALWSVLGFALSRRLMPAALALPSAPILGWALHSAIALPIHGVIGFTSSTVGLESLAALIIALLSLVPRQKNKDHGPEEIRLPLWAYGMAALVAVLPAIALLPKISGDAVTLAHPIFDHSKIAMINEMTRLGVPPGNPFFGEAGQEAPLTYYYLWHFAAAELALAFGLSGWEADIALTAFTAFSSLTLMMGFAIWIGGRVSAGIWVLPLAFAASLHPVVEWAFGQDTFYAIFLRPTGLAGWLFQTSWAPQHVAAASCVLLSCFLLVRCAWRPSALTVIVLALTVVTGYESSTWVGGILFGLASVAVAIILLLGCPPRTRASFLVAAAIAALLAVALAYPFWRDQLFNAAARQAGSPVALLSYPVFENAGEAYGSSTLLNVLGYWLAFLVIEFPAIYITGLIALFGSVRSKAMPALALQTSRAFLGLALMSLVVTSGLASSFANNNDLGWRAILPGLFVLTIFAAVGLSGWLAAIRISTPPPDMMAHRARGRYGPAALALLLLVLGLPQSFRIATENLRGTASESDRAFSATPALWEAVRRHSGPSERVANNPLFVEKMTPWPITISWALLSNRRSCFAASDFILPFTSLPRGKIADIDAQFRRVFDGTARETDVREIATRYQCRVLVLTPEDGAWRSDHFAASGIYKLAEEKADAWKVYRATEAALSR
jgi:hypothetical protein